MRLAEQLDALLLSADYRLSTISPSDWAESNIHITSGKYQGRLSLDKTPYSREILDRASPYDPCTEITVCGGSQWGKSTTVLEPAILYRITQYPTNIGMLTGHADLSEEAMIRFDNVIEASDLRKYIQPQVSKAKSSRTGDTVKGKEYAGGVMVSGSMTNHKLLRQRTWGFVAADDLDAAKVASKESGDTVEMVRERTKALGSSKKIFWVSTPELMESSLIWKLFLDGDQRRWHWPCPHCGETIYLQWSIDIEGTDEKAGFVWQTDPHTGDYVPGSVEYVCDKCAGAFKENLKYELNKAGIWIPGAQAKNPLHHSYHMPSLYAMPGMNGWDDCVYAWLRANPGNGQPAIKSKLQVFYNQTLGLPYEQETAELDARGIMSNTREGYMPGQVPEALSISDGNGSILLLTITADLGGFEDDARLDYTVMATAVNGATYGVLHGSIGTFFRGDETKGAHREKWTYQHGMPFCIWDAFDKIVDAIYESDMPNGKRMKAAITAVDTGFFTNLAYDYIDRCQKKGWNVVGVKGDTEERLIRVSADRALFKKGKNHQHLYIVDTTETKDTLAEYMALEWERSRGSQPYGYMNFPQPRDGMYQYDNFFSHFEAEHFVKEVTKTGIIMGVWKKKDSKAANHMFDCYCYQLVAREIFLSQYAKLNNLKTLSWLQFSQLAIKAKGVVPAK